MSMPQVVPVKPVLSQLHVNMLTPSSQEPPFWHGLLSHSSIFTCEMNI